MELSNYASKFKLKKQSPAQTLATEVYEYFHKELSFGRIMKLIKENGDQCVREVFIETIKANVKEPIGLFLWSMKKYKTIWQ